MNKLDQFYKLHHIFEGRRTPVPLSQLARELEVTERTVRRYIEDFQLYWDAPLVHYPRRGWMYDPEGRDKWEVPGLWMTTEECQSLTLLLDILTRFGNGLLNDELKGMRASVDKALATRGISRTELEARIRIIPIGQRYVPDKQLHQVLNAFIQGNRLHIRYRDYGLKVTKRTVSPQRLVYYRDNWYMDAWCHRVNDLRSFSLARIERCEHTENKAELIAQEKLDAEFMSSYGIFAGAGKYTATLRFFPAVAREIARQEWHPDQQGQCDGDDYILRIPYSDSRELVMDILSYLPHVLVEEPASLREAIKQRLHETLDLYESTGQKTMTKTVKDDDYD